MSASAQKEARREIRRAVGEGALSAFETLSDRVKKVENDLFLRKDVPYLVGKQAAERDARLKADLTILADGLGELGEVMASMLAREIRLKRSFWARVQWLFSR
jgi:hypothetical protein